MSDKMLMEDWRKYLTEEELLEEDLTALMGALPDWRVVGQAILDLPAQAGRAPRDKYEAFLTRRRNEHQKMETQSDSLLQSLEDKEMWNWIFDLYKSNQGAGAWVSVIKHFHDKGKIQGDIEEWVKIVGFVLVCYQTNIDESVAEKLEDLASPMGETSKSNSRTLRTILTGLGGALISSVSVKAGTWLAYNKGWIENQDQPIVAALVPLSVGLVPPILGWLETHVKKRDFQKAILPYLLKNLPRDEKGELNYPELEKGYDAGTGEIDKELYDEVVADTSILAFHMVENVVLKQLSKNPYKLPSVPYESLGKQLDQQLAVIRKGVVDAANTIQKDLEKPPPEIPKTDWSGKIVAESRFHDNWRGFLLTEEKL